MKAKITRGKTFKGLLNYIFDKGNKATGDKAPIIVGGNMAGASPQQLTREFVAVRQLRPDIERAVWHCSLSLPPGEHPTNEQWDEITKDFMQGMGFSDYTPYVVVRHNDKEHDHIHIVASRIGGDSKAWIGEWEVYKAIEVTQQLEEKYNLTRVAFKPAQKKRATYKELHKAERLGVTPPRVQLQELIDEAVADKPTAPQFAFRLEDKGVIVRANVASTGRMNGFSFELDGLAFKGSSLGKAYSWSGLQKRGVTYEPETDAAGLERYRLPVEERPPRTDETLPEVSSSTLTVETSLELEADTDSTSPEPGAEKMLRALEGYYQSEINKNKEAIETSPKQDFAENSPTGTAPTASDVDTDSVEAAKLEAAINAVSEIFNQSVEQGKSRALSEFFSSESSLAKKGTAQQGSTEADPEATQPSVDKCALSEIPQEQNQQQQWVEILSPKLVYLLNNEQTFELKGKHRTVAWNEEQQRLTLRENETQEIVLDAKWKEGRWQDNGSSLTATDFEQLRQVLDRYNRERERELQKQRSLGGFELD
ncbi:MAG: relaxase/mobilization nuclease domain-containing protein [Cyanobacteria bacterium P01_G01_bin.49]